MARVVKVRGAAGGAITFVLFARSVSCFALLCTMPQVAFLASWIGLPILSLKGQTGLANFRWLL